MKKPSTWHGLCEAIAFIGFVLVLPVGAHDWFGCALGGALLIAGGIGRFLIPAELVGAWIKSRRRPH